MSLAGGSSPDEQAAVWLARLRNRSVTTAELDDFGRWRRDPVNATAYRRAEASRDDPRRRREDPDHFATPGSANQGSIRHRTSWATLALIGVLAVVFTAFGFHMFDPMPTARVYRTAVGERSTAMLDDGSEMQLDVDSEVSARFNGAHRTVVLARGQAFFAVRHDAARPFVVEAGDGLTVTALGTRFDVLLIDRKVRVTLAEGSIAVRRSGALLATLKPGEVVVVDGTGPAVPLRRPVADVLAWRNGHLSFRDTPLEQAIAEVNRYTARPFAVGSGTNAQARVSGEFSTNDPQGFADTVEALLGETAIERVPQ